MKRSDIPDAVRRFVGAYVDSLEQLEVVLWLHGNAHRSWTADEVTMELRLSRDSVSRRLERLHAQRLLLREDGAPPTYRFDAGNQALAQDVAAVARTYKERRVSVVNLIFSNPVDNVLEFADAFKLKKDR